MEAVQAPTSVVTLTEGAAMKLRSLIEEKNLAGYGLRVFVSGGGCSGLQYGMAFENQTVEGDNVVETDGVTIYVDQVSAMYLSGSSIDYVENLMGGGFKIENPNAIASCGCGQSFRTGEGEGNGGGCSSCG